MMGNRTSARQKHGYKFEDYIKDELGLDDSSILKHDAYINKSPVSIKSSKLTGKNKDNFTIYLGSIFNLTNIDEGVKYFRMIIGVYNDKLTSKKDIDEIIYLKIPIDKFLEQVNLEVIDDLKNTKSYLKYQVFNKEDQDATKEQWKEFRNKTNKEWNKSGKKAINLNYKRDSKGQCRMQASMTKRNLEKYFNPYKVTKEDFLLEK